MSEAYFLCLAGGAPDDVDAGGEGFTQLAIRHPFGSHRSLEGVGRACLFIGYLAVGREVVNAVCEVLDDGSYKDGNLAPAAFLINSI